MNKQKLIILTGAGISAESGLRTFRDSDGLWEGYNIADVATPRAWKRDAQLVQNFYNMRRADVLAAQPNAAHIGLARLQDHYEVHIITQNIDDLHERAGSQNVLHLHGEILKMRSEFDTETLYPIIGNITLDMKAPDGGRMRPHVVWFEEPVPMIEHAVPLMQEADVFVLVGTSLAVYPAAGLVDFVADHVPKYVMDKRIPEVKRFRNVIPIEQPATAGIRTLFERLGVAY